MKLTKKISAAAATSALALGALFGAAPAAEAWNGMYYVQSRPYQVWADISADGRQGILEAKVRYGGIWYYGARSYSHSQVSRSGWSWDHAAHVYARGILIAAG